MGLDIAFNRKQALEAGLEIVIRPNASPESIARAEADDDFDVDYMIWVSGSSPCVQVPGTELLTIDGGTAEDIIVRANKWGHAYAPLTAWLKTNNIHWSEF